MLKKYHRLRTRPTDVFKALGSIRLRLGKYQAPTTYVGKVLHAVQTPPLKASNQQKSTFDRSNILKLAKIRFDS